VYARNVKDKNLTFDFAEGLIKDNLLFVDRETNSIWSQLQGKAVSGPMENTPLQIVPSQQVTWKYWLKKHPDTKVFYVPDKKGFPYLYRNRKPGAPRPKERQKTHDTSTLGLGLVINNQPVYFPLHELAKAKTPFGKNIGGQKVQIFYKTEAMSAWAKDAKGKLLSTVLCYKNGWLSFYPNSEIFKAKN